MIGLARGLHRRGKRLDPYLAALSETDRKRFESLYAEVVRTATSKTESRRRRLEVVSFLKHVGGELAEPALKQLVLDENDQSVRLAAISALAAFPPGDTDRQLLKRFNSQSPESKRVILDLLLSGTNRTKTLLDEIAARRISVNELDPLRVRRLTRHRDRDIRDRALKLLAAAIPADRKQVLVDYQPALTMKADAKRGVEVFRKNCTACHRVGEHGVNVAPDISDSRTKTPAQLLVSILDPNRAIDNNYISYTAVTADGKVHTGVIATETASSITLRQQENKTVTLLRKDVETLKSNGISLMPVGLEKNITVQQMADLIAYIKNWRYLDGRVPIRHQEGKNR
jgi:putative heme-binding domain-containing protein